MTIYALFSCIITFCIFYDMNLPQNMAEEGTDIQTPFRKTPAGLGHFMVLYYAIFNVYNLCA